MDGYITVERRRRRREGSGGGSKIIKMSGFFYTDKNDYIFIVKAWVLT